MIEYDNTAWMITYFPRWNGSVVPRSLIIALPSACLCVILMVLNEESEEFKTRFASDSVTGSQLWAAMTAVLAYTIGFRTNKAYARFWEGTTLLHQMRGEWFDSVSCLISFSTLARKAKPTEVADFRHALVRLMSLCHGSALEEIQEDRQDGGFKYLDMAGLDQSTLRYLKESKSHLRFNRVEVLIHMMQTLIVHAQDAGILKIAPPILSRVFQTLSRGQVNLMNCKKIKATLFPFPYVQVISILLHVLAVMTPVVMSGMIEQYHWGFVLTFIPVFGLVTLNYVAAELEMPFGDDSNDLPLSEMQNEMNTSLLMLVRDETDHVAHTSQLCAMDYNLLCRRLESVQVQDFLEEARFEQPPEQHPEPEPLPIVAAAAQAARQSQTPAKAAPAAPAPSGSGSALEVKALEQALQDHVDHVEKLSQSFQLLVKNTFSLSENLSQNTELMTTFSKDVYGWMQAQDRPTQTAAPTVYLHAPPAPLAPEKPMWPNMGCSCSEAATLERQRQADELVLARSL